MPLGTGYYLSPGGGGGNRIFWGDHLIFRRTEGGSVVTESPKGGSLKILEGFRGDHQKSALTMLDMGGGFESYQ